MDGNGQHEMQSRGGGLAVRAARFTAAVEPQMRAVGGDWTLGLGPGLYLGMPCGQRPILTVP